jgi:hypothetical protein
MKFALGGPEGSLIASRPFLMNRELIIRLCIVVLALLIAAMLSGSDQGGERWHEAGGFIVLGVTGGILMVKFVIPWIGDAMGEAVFSSGEQVEQDEMTKAAACISQGDYPGAIEPLRKDAGGQADDPFPVAEIAKVYAERLHDPQSALHVLSDHLQSKDWPVDDAAFIMFRIADVH